MLRSTARSARKQQQNKRSENTISLLATLFSCLRKIRTQNGGRLTPLNLQWYFADIGSRWDDDVVFRNQARGTENKGKKEFVNV